MAIRQFPIHINVVIGSFFQAVSVQMKINAIHFLGVQADGGEE